MTASSEVNSPCEICGSGDSREWKVFDFASLGYSGPFVLRRCVGCGLAFNSPRLDDDGLARLYDANYYFFQRPDSEAFRRIPHMYARTVGAVRALPESRRCLEVGSARGYFLAVLGRLGWRPEGVEISESAAAYARARFSASVHVGTLESIADGRPERRFPLLLAIDLIEHVPRPRAFVRSLRRAAEPGATIIIDTPNGGAANIDRLGNRWKGFNPFHVFLFDPRNLRRLLESEGFVVDRCASYGDDRSDAAGGGPGRWLRLAAERVGLRGAARRASLVLRRGRDSLVSSPEGMIERCARAIRDAEGSAGDPFLPGSSTSGDNLVVFARVPS